ncbi:MAG: stage II sporulation protein M [Candidatus Woesearchaeota archaeon]|nr:stage II sporulation protein M [Candidatus Woesearchaeota archaeon]
MVLEDINTGWLLDRPYVSFFLGFMYSIIGYIIATLFFFENSVSVAMLFLTTLLMVPTFVGVLSHEEGLESRQPESGIFSFLKNHRTIIEVYILIFLGAFIGFVVLGVLAADKVPLIFNYQLDFLSTREGITTKTLDHFFSTTNVPTVPNALGIVQHNLSVALIAFFLSVVFGAGALFLIVLNASVFASFGVLILRYLATDFSGGLKIILIFGTHLVPELAGFILAAIAGGVVSKALLTESFGSDGFKNVVRDSLYLFLVSCILILAAAFLEIYVTADLFAGFPS